MDDRVKELEAKIARLEARLAPSHVPHDAEVEVTACVLAYNNWRHLWEVLTAFWRQDVSLHLLTAMDRASVDPTVAILSWPDMEKYLTGGRSHTVRSYRYLGDIPHKRLEDVCAHAKAKFADACEPPWIYICDGDVVTPNGAIRRLLDEMKADESIGALCVPYEQKTDHQLQGAMLMRTEVARRVGFSGKNRCVCWDLAQRLKAAGLSMKPWACGEMAVHLKWRR